jgi:hypothetical protein
MKIPDKLFDLAFKYKSKKLWNKLYDDNIFAVKFSNGEIGYICIMGRLGRFNAVNIYIGNNGFRSLDELYDALPGFDLQERFFQQNCLQCAFDSKEDLSDDELSAVYDYAKRNGIQFRGKNAYPHFLKFEPDCYPWYTEEEEDYNYFSEALEVCIEVSERLENKSLAIPRYLNSDNIPLLEKTESGFVISETEIPSTGDFAYPTPELDDITAKKIKSFRKAGSWECDIFALPEPVQNDPTETPCFPRMLIAVDQETDFVIATMPVNKYMNNSQKMLNSLSHRLIDSEVCPEIILIKNDMTRDFFDEFCTKLDITIYKTNQLPAFENAKADLFEHINEDLGKVNEASNKASIKDELNYDDTKSDLTELFRNLQALGEDENGNGLDDDQFNDFLDLMFDCLTDTTEPPKKTTKRKKKKNEKKPKE